MADSWHVSASPNPHRLLNPVYPVRTWRSFNNPSGGYSPLFSPQYASLPLLKCFGLFFSFSLAVLVCRFFCMNKRKARKCSGYSLSETPPSMDVVQFVETVIGKQLTFLFRFQSGFFYEPRNSLGLRVHRSVSSQVRRFLDYSPAQVN